MAFINAGNSSRTISYDLVEIFGGITNNELAQQAWNLFDLWGNETVIPSAAAAMVLDGIDRIENVDHGRWYYNASETSWADGLANNNTLLLGTPAGSVEAPSTLIADVPSHRVAMWRLKSADKGITKKEK